MSVRSCRLKMILLIILIFYDQLKISFGQYNVYHTETKTFNSDCLYEYLEDIGSITDKKFPWCIRREIVNDFDMNNQICHGNEITFKQLKTNNISIANLFYWNAVIDVIDLYEKYLLLPNLVNENEVYCNCSILTRFGKFCQYDMDQDDNRNRILSYFFWIPEDIDVDEEAENTHFTCYIGISCQTNLFCLDWRQICNGIVDCDHGEDEPVELCLQIESNECDTENEYRCENGFCIPLSLASDSTAYCFDQSDWRKIYDKDTPNFLFELCLSYPSRECDRTYHGWKQFSCNNGQYMSYSDLTLKTFQYGRTCVNNRHLLYLKELFSTTNEDPCWKAMICLTGFDYLYSHIICSSNEIIQRNINEYCQNEFYFPSNSIVYSYVFFFYEKINRHNWLYYSGPNYICYKKEYCPNKTWTLSRNDLNCFPVDQQIFTWKNFYEYVVHMFSSCYSRIIDVDEKMLFKCNSSQTLISIYRVKDKKKDCFFNDDESESIDLCQLRTNDQFQCFTNQSQCIRRLFLNDKEYDCSDGSDEYFETNQIVVCQQTSCEPFSWKKRTPPEMYRFSELCDNILNRQLFSKDSNETDETDCERWLYTCNSPYTNCDQIWNCPDGRDEIDCQNTTFNDYIRLAFRCRVNEHYCLQLINNSNEINTSCLNFSRMNDGISDCIGGTDERSRNICMDKYPIDYRRRFHCLNSSECIRTDQICDRKIDCPFEDDERICPWLWKSNSSTFYCNNALSNSPIQCKRSEMRNRQCQMKEHLWFCDLEMIRYKAPITWSVAYKVYPPYIDENTDTTSLNTDQLIRSRKKRTSLPLKTNSKKWLCNFGFRLRSHCLCPPAYYGEYCQFQTEYLTVILLVEVRYFIEKLTVFRLLVYLLNENHTVVSYEELICNDISSEKTRYSVYLMYDGIKGLSLQQRTNSKFVRIDSYIINETYVEYVSSWMFPVLFPFLPVNKLIVQLSLVNQSSRIFNCKKTCGLHGKCMYYRNARDIEYCWCEQGWFGDTCELEYSSNLCNQTSCASHAQCIIINNNKKKCLCPLGKYGSECYITHNSCKNITCINGGTCLPIRQLSNEGVICVCTDDYLGEYCDISNSRSNISIDANITNVSQVPAIILLHTTTEQNKMRHSSQFLYYNVRLPIVLTTTQKLQEFIFIQVYHNFSKYSYYVGAIQRQGSGRRYLNTSIIEKNRCKEVSELFNQTVLYEYSYLKRMKLYHLPCHYDHDLRCFFDEYRMCICTLFYRSDCLLFPYDHSNCSYCMNNGLCLSSDKQQEYWKFFCICPDCTDGNLCQFSLGNYYVTLDTLVGKEIKQGEISFNEQSTIIHLTLGILILILVFSFICNTISLMILSNKKMQQVGCDFYLLNLTIISQIGLILLFLRFIYMILIQIYIIDNQLFLKISCILLEYSVRLIPSIFDWLTVCISVERTYTIIKSIHFTQMIALKTLKLSRWIVLIVILVNILTTLHRPFHLILVDEINFTDEPQGHPWCVLNLPSTSWNTYEKAINICHLVLPLIFNMLSVMFFILRKTQFELTSTLRKDKRTRSSVLYEQLLKYKVLLISTTIIILLEIPRFILTFILSCIKHSWQRYLYLAGYLISFLPLSSILFIYILPSPKHNLQLKTIIKKFYRNT